MLLEENIASVNHLYNESRDVSADYTYRHPLQSGWSIPELLNPLHCYQHQACEHPCWASSQAHAFCDALQQRLIHRLPGLHRRAVGHQHHQHPRPTPPHLTTQPEAGRSHHAGRAGSGVFRPPGLGAA